MNHLRSRKKLAAVAALDLALTVSACGDDPAVGSVETIAASLAPLSKLGASTRC